MCLKKWLLIFFLCYLPCVHATPYYGAQFSYVLVPKEPADIHGYQLFLNYLPDTWQGTRWEVYLDGGFSHFWVNNSPYRKSLNIYSLAPVFRFYLRQRYWIRPYVEVSLGIAYLTRTRLDSRNLGIHFSFQDRAGVGILIAEHFSLGFHALHYSNAHFSSHNSGLTAPVVFDMSYRFG